MKISIITICFNNEKDIRPTIESVVGQSYDNIEYIIVDGASKDQTLSIINEYEDRISRVISEPDKGLYDAINKGLRVATGEVVGLIHAGDRLHDKEVISDIAAFFANNKVDISYGYSLIVDEKGKVKRVNRSPHYSSRLLEWGWMPSHQSIYLKRNLLDRYGYYRLDIGSAADYEWVVRYFYLHGKDLIIRRLNRYVLYFTLGGQSSANIRKITGKKQRQSLRFCWEVNGLKAPCGVVYKKWLWKIKQLADAAFYKLCKRRNRV